MRRVLMISPHFPPDSSAATHRVRLLAPHLPEHGWEPTVLTVDPSGYDGALDRELASMVPPQLEVVRCGAWPAAWTRRMGIGDLGLRAYTGLRRAARGLIARERFDALFITTYPTYPAMLGPSLKRRAGVPFIVDFQDPWVGAWGLTVGGGPNGARDAKSRLSRWLAAELEPRVVRAADAITAVSDGTWEQLRARHPALAVTPCVTIPLGGEPADFLWLERHPRPSPAFDAADGLFHLCHVGTLLPLAIETLRALLAAARLIRTRRPDLYARLRIHFVGSSNQRAGDAPPRAIPIARQAGIEDIVSEMAGRVEYLEALATMSQAGAILAMGSSEPHYTASRIYPALLARRPVLALYHAMSGVVDALRRTARPPSVRLVTFDERCPAATRTEAIAAELAAMIEDPAYVEGAIDAAALDRLSARAMAGRLAGVLDRAKASGPWASA